jgi:hypothetical protein
MDWDSLHTQAKATTTGSATVQPKRYMVGIIRLGKNVHRLEELDFVWVKAHSRITVAKLLDVFSQREQLQTEIELQFQGQTLPLDSTVKMLNAYGDDVVVLRAVEKRSVASKPTSPQALPPARQPVLAGPRTPSPRPRKKVSVPEVSNEMAIHPKTPVSSRHSRTPAANPGIHFPDIVRTERQSSAVFTKPVHMEFSTPSSSVRPPTRTESYSRTPAVDARPFTPAAVKNERQAFRPSQKQFLWSADQSEVLYPLLCRRIVLPVLYQLV